MIGGGSPARIVQQPGQQQLGMPLMAGQQYVPQQQYPGQQHPGQLMQQQHSGQVRAQQQYQPQSPSPRPQPVPQETKPMTIGSTFLSFATVVQAVCVVCFLVYGEATGLAYQEPLSAADHPGIPEQVSANVQNIQIYNNYIGVTIMMFIGFGYLMTFLRWYGLGAVGLTMFITALGMQVGILTQHFWKHLVFDGFSKVPIDFMAFVQGDFAVATFLISFGGLIGKVNPTQLVVLVVLEAIFYQFNAEVLMFRWLKVADVGGSIVIHMFGAYFGLACSWVLGQPSRMEKEESSKTSDLFSFIGTLFLWIYWPSFVGGATPAGSVEWDTALTNTVMALLGSCVASFILSGYLSHNILRPVDIQNATLAGGVSIGSLANLYIRPGGALCVGILAGLLSTCGFCKIQDYLKDTFGLHDSCGINNLHGMPSILSGVISIFVPFFITQGRVGAPGVPMHQFLAIVTTLAVSIASGLFTGTIMKGFKDEAEGFVDREYWEVAEEMS